MSLNRMVCVAGMVVLTGGAWGPAAIAQPEDAAVEAAGLPSGFEVLERMVEATGGAERQKAMKSTRFAGKIRIEHPLLPEPIDGTIEILRAAPNMQRVLAQTPFGPIDQGTDGKSAWNSQPGAGLLMLEGEELETAISDADFYKNLEPRKEFSSAENVGIVESEGQRCYELKLTSHQGEVTTEHYSVESGLLIKSVSKEQSISYSDHKTVEGVVTAGEFRIVIDLPQGQVIQMITFDEIEIDPGLTASKFAVPGSF